MRHISPVKFQHEMVPGILKQETTSTFVLVVLILKACVKSSAK